MTTIMLLGYWLFISTYKAILHDHIHYSLVSSNYRFEANVVVS